MIKRVLSVSVDAGLLLVMLLAWGTIAALGAGFLEIAFAWKVFSSTAGLIVLSAVTLIGAGFLSIAGPNMAFGQTPGQSLFFRKKDPGSRPVLYWFAWLGILTGVYFVMWLASAAIFNPMVNRQRAVLQANGLPADWRQAFLEYSAEGNAAPILKMAGESLRTCDSLSKEKSIDWAFRIFTEVQDSVTFIWPTVDRLTVINAGPLELAEKASRCERLCWYDYRNTAVDSLASLPIPNYIALQRLCKLTLLQGARAVRMGRVEEARSAIDRTNRLLKLQMDDPTLMGKMITMVQVGIISNGLAGMARIAPRSYILIKNSCSGMPDVSGQLRKGLINEFAVLTAVFDNISRELPGLGPKGWRTFGMLFGGVKGPDIVAALVAAGYSIWAPWDRYCFYKSAELALTSMDRREKASFVAEWERRYNIYKERHNRIPALLTNIIMPNFVAMYKKEIETRGKPANALVFAAVLDYRINRGKMPQNLAAIVPEYFAKLPQNPINGKYYTYILEKNRMEVRGNDFKGEPLLRSTTYEF